MSTDILPDTKCAECLAPFHAHDFNWRCPAADTKFRPLGWQGVELIRLERDRQIDAEGYTAAHDDEHENKCQLLLAGRAYALHALVTLTLGTNLPEPPPKWPWNRLVFKPGTPIRDLIKAGALLAAEIDRLQRLEESNGKSGGVFGMKVVVSDVIPVGLAVVLQPGDLERLPAPQKPGYCTRCDSWEVVDGECQNCGVNVVSKMEGPESEAK